MKIALITANFGGIDTRREEVPQELPDGMEYKRFYYTEENSPFPFPNLPNRLKAKYFKLQSHRVPELWPFDFHIWIDANIDLKPGALESFASRLSGCDIAINRHHHRETVKQEVKFVTAQLPTNDYLRTRYADQKLITEFEYLKSLGMSEDAPLYSCNMFGVYWPAMSARFDEWWSVCLTHSYFDQAAFSLVAEKYIKEGGYINTLFDGPYYDNPLFAHHNHAKIQ